MARFFFDVHDGVDRIDEHGIDLLSWNAARSAALRIAKRLLESEAQRECLGAEWHMNVRNDVGLILFRLDFQVCEAPVLQSFRPAAAKAP